MSYHTILGQKLATLRQQIIESGEPLLSWEQIEYEDDSPVSLTNHDTSSQSLDATTKEREDCALKHRVAPFHLSLPPHWWQCFVWPHMQWDVRSVARADKPAWSAGRASLWDERIGPIVHFEWNVDRIWKSQYLLFAVNGSDDEWQLRVTPGPCSFSVSGSLPRWVHVKSEYQRMIGVIRHRWYLHFFFWADPEQYDSEWDWSNPASDLRKPLINLNPFNLIAGNPRCDTECLGIEQRTVLMPEGAYPVTVKKMVRQWSYPRWKYDCPIPRRRYSLEIKSESGVPLPGDGENSWDCEDDAMSRMNVPGRDVEQALHEATDTILACRLKHGGPDWRPEQNEQGPAVCLE